MRTTHGLIKNGRLLWMILVRSIRVSPTGTVLALVEAVGRLIQALNPLFLGLITAATVSRRPFWFIAAAAGLLLATALNFVLQLIGTTARMRQIERVSFSFDVEIAEVTARIETLDHLEAPTYLDKFQALSENANAVGNALGQVLNFLNDLVWATTAIMVAAAADPRMLILIVLSVPPVLAQRVRNRWHAAAEDQGAEPSRLARDLLKRTIAVKGGAEVRTFGLAGVLRRRVEDATTSWREAAVQLSVRTALLDGSLSVLYFSGGLAILAWLLADTIAGRIGITDFVIALTSLAAIQQLATVLVGSATWTARSIRIGERYLWLLDHAQHVSAAHNGKNPVPEQLTTGIQLHDVSYRYPGNERWALDRVSLTLPAGSVVAVVGENGAGKSTLVKILTGLYDPTQGLVSIDGRDMQDLDLAAWRSATAGAFQDHADLELTAQHTIGTGDLAHLDDTDAAHRALRESGDQHILHSLPMGLATQLGTSWPDGVDLSGGQWQRLALARALMRTAPVLLILDEPTSALDAAAEHALFERYAAAARTATQRRGITLLVTHRFSTVAAADLVIVMDEGRAIEVGAHDELMRAGGTYAELYGLQADGYR